MHGAVAVDEAADIEVIDLTMWEDDSTDKTRPTTLSTTSDNESNYLDEVIKCMWK